MKKQRLLTLALSCACVFTSAAAFGIWSLDTEKANAAWTNETTQKSTVDYELEGYELEAYVVAQNDDFGGAATLSWGSDATSNLTLTNTTETASFVYKFNFTPNSGGDTALAVRSSYWGDYYFIFRGKTLWYALNDTAVKVGEVFTDGVQVVEVGAIDVKDSNLTWFFLKVNGEIKMSETASDVPDKKAISVWGDQTAKLEQVSFYEESELEDYVIAQNDDFGGGSTLSWGSDATSNLKLTNTTETASFVYKFSFTPNDGSGQTALALRSSYWGSYYFVFKAKTLWYHLNSTDVKVGEVFTDGAQVVEVGAIDIKNSNLTWFYLKIDGRWIVSETASDVPDKKGISIWGPQAVFAQYSYNVTFTDVEMKEVLAGQAIGTLPETPANENELLGWFDQDGNQVTAETVVTKDLTVTSVFAEPHNVTFMVDGEVYETYENVAYNTAIGELPVAPKKAGYDFVKWTYGGEEVTAETVVSAHMTIVAEYAERGYYLNEELEEYVVAQNDDFGGAATLSWGGDATSGLTLKNDLPTASFVYKFSYTPNGGDQTALALRSSYWGAYHFVFKGKTLQYNLNASYVAVGEVFTDGAQLVEVGAIEIKNSDLTWFFLKVNGEEKMSATAANVPDVKGISAWGDETAALSQYSWTVDFNGEKKEVLNGAAIGELPTAPESEFEIIGWADQHGNILTAETVAKENITATLVFNEPHTVIFVANGQTLATVENVGYRETVTLPEYSVPGYDFVKWVYGDNEEFTAETQVVSNLTITAVLIARDFTEEELADYITVTNKDIGAAASIKNTNSSFTNYKIATENETSSVVYQFVYEKGEKPLYIVLRDIINGWGTNAGDSGASGYTFILLGAKLETPVDKLVADAFSGEASLYLVEIGVIDVKDSNEVWIYVKVNGNKIVDGRMEKCANVGNYIGMFGDDASTSTINEADDYHFLEGVVAKHTVVEVEGLAATCTEAGYTAYSYCEVCNESLVAKEILDALGHEEETVEGYAATCTETGLTDGAVCKVCGETTVAQTEIGALGHDLQAVEAVAPGCETVGATAGERCIHEGCDMIVSGCEEVPATGHTEVKDEAVPSTCIERGKTEGSHCGTCGKILQEQESLPLADHNYVEGVCSVCGDEDASAVTPEDSSKDDNNGLSGCFGSIGAAFSGVTMAIGAMFLCVKKKKEEK